jgi:hypothetical protein
MRKEMGKFSKRTLSLGPTLGRAETEEKIPSPFTKIWKQSAAIQPEYLSVYPFLTQ